MSSDAVHRACFRLTALPLVALGALAACTSNLAEAVDGGGADEQDQGDEAADTESDTESESNTGTTEDTSSETTEDTSSETGEPDSIRVVFFADTHVVGPTYQGDDPSLLGAETQLDVVRWELEQFDPAPDLAILLGDIVHGTYPSQDAAYYQNNPNAFAIADELLGAFPCPVYPVFGDNDYDVPDVPQAFSHTLFAQFFAKDPYYAFEAGGWRFVVTNSSSGTTFQPQAVDFDPSIGSYGEAQLNWVADQLDDGVPTVLTSHFPMNRTAADETETAGATDMATLLTTTPGSLELIFAGHGELWATIPDEYGAPMYQVGATRYDTDNFLLVEFFPDGSYELLDIDKVQWNTPNADHWDYSNGTPVPAE